MGGGGIGEGAVLTDLEGETTSRGEWRCLVVVVEVEVEVEAEVQVMSIAVLLLRLLFAAADVDYSIGRRRAELRRSYGGSLSMRTAGYRREEYKEGRGSRLQDMGAESVGRAEW